jgi:membrane fusion protein, type I secretion system
VSSRNSAESLSYIPEPAAAARLRISPILLLGLGVIGLFFLGFGGWASFAPLESAALAPGVVTVETNRKTVQHLEGGIVGEILVHEGDAVEAGQVLIRLSDIQPKAKLEQLLMARLVATALATRLQAERDGKATIEFPAWLMAQITDPRAATVLQGQLNLFDAHSQAQAGQMAILQQKIAQSEKEITGLEGEIQAEVEQLKLLEEEIVSLSILLEKGLVEKSRVLALKRRKAEIQGSRSRNQGEIARIRQEIIETQIRITELDTTRINDAADELQDVDERMIELDELIRAAEDVLDRTEVRAPNTGRVVSLAVHTTGGVIKAGQPLMDIVPDHERLLVDVQIDPSDIDVVAAGQTVEIRLTAFPQRHVLPIEGRLLSVSADRMVDDKSQRIYFLGRVELGDEADSASPKLQIQPGMQAEVTILTGRSTMLEYLLRPLTRTIERSLREV